MFLVYLAIFLVCFVLMELLAWFSHKYIMHGIGWRLHRDHHLKHSGFFELNDLYFLIFALPGFSLTFIGIFLFSNSEIFLEKLGLDIFTKFAGIFLSSGLGISFYGLVYILFHDVFVHQRFKFINSKKIKNPYLSRLRQLHNTHHGNKNQKGGTNFGFLWVR